MTPWKRIRDVIDDRQPMHTVPPPNSDLEQGKISDAVASPQNRPVLPRGRGAPNSPPVPKPPRRRRPPGQGEIDIHIRIPARFRGRLEVRRRELGTSLTGTILELVRRGLEEPPPGLRNLRRRDARQDLVEEAVLATLLAVELTRLELETALPKAIPSADSGLADLAAWEAEQRLSLARQALGDMKA